ncbi:CLUMA_CG012123, isoform A [Clunio marinus]|uniref:CLUMA_CG012123, isoform A n=1 Tax=Clunio marinus TaxID=568069 RepID=A0A1J1IES8_9DIPT|nr:CLUMA_CG012123, isoform A [Clunio marinus]
MERTIKLSTVRSTLGLLTTVHQLPTNYQVQYIKIKTETPLDLTIKPFADQLGVAMTPPSTPSPIKKRYREIENEDQTKPFETKILSPLKKRYRENDQKFILTPQQIKQETTPKKSSARITSINQKSSKNPPTTNTKERKSKAIRKLKFDEFRSSPVSGTIIRTLEEIDENDIQESGDIDPQYNIVEVTDEAKNELAQIPNVIGAYLCKLCRIEFDDAFGLARHRCNCIVLLEYRCPECGKKFNCPANLASHRRWHKPRDQMNKKTSESSENEPSFPCKECGKCFKRQAYLKKHLATHNKKPNATTTMSTLNNHKKLSLLQNESSASSFNAHSSHSHDSADILIPQPVFNFNRTESPTPSSDSEHELVINENSNSSINSMASTASAKFNLLSNRFTEDENIAISALANLRSGSSVIRHTLAV